MKTRFTLAVCGLMIACAASRATELYIAPDGNDSNLGTRTAPLKTLKAARDAIRKLKHNQDHLADGATI